MSTVLDRLIYRARNRTPFLKIFDPPPSRRREIKTPVPPPRTPQAGMFRPKTVGIKRMEDYGARSLTKAEVKEAMAELEKMREQHAAEITAPIKSYSGPGDGFGEQHNGIGLTSGFARRATAEYNARIAGLRRDLRSDVDRVLPQAKSAKMPPIKMAHSLEPLT